MFRVSYNNIFITRGDTGVVEFSISGYELKANDTVVLTVKNNINASETLVEKQLDKNTMQFVINPNDTKNLAYGTYTYDVQITTAQGEVYTVIVPHNFEVGGEVTW